MIRLRKFILLQFSLILNSTFSFVLHHRHTVSSRHYNSSNLFSITKDFSPLERVTSCPTRSLLFSLSQSTAGALLGPLLDSYHSAFGVLRYDDPVSAQLWSRSDVPALITTWWVPPLFAFAGLIIGWMYILLDGLFKEDSSSTPRGVTSPIILLGISCFTFQYWFSGVLYDYGYDRSFIFMIMSLCAYFGYNELDRTKSGLVTSLVTAIGGPLIEVMLITVLSGTNGGYHYNDAGETGFFPLWIVPMYFLGGPANGNLARGVWSTLGKALHLHKNSNNIMEKVQCTTCENTRAVPCPNCDGIGYYSTYGNEVKCNCCKGRGLVICRECFAKYGEDPEDINAIRELMNKIPD